MFNLIGDSGQEMGSGYTGNDNWEVWQGDEPAVSEGRWVELPVWVISNNPMQYLGKRCRQNQTEGILCQNANGSFRLEDSSGQILNNNYSGSSDWYVWEGPMPGNMPTTAKPTAETSRRPASMDDRLIDLLLHVSSGLHTADIQKEAGTLLHELIALFPARNREEDEKDANDALRAS